MTINCNNEAFQKLYRKVKIVTNIRFSCARRLKTHQKLSQWITTLLSFLLIIVPLSQALDIQLKHSENFLNLVTVSLAIFLLVYSLLIGIENYGGRADKMHQCGTELSYLARKITPYLETIYSKEVYESFSQEYQVIIERYENHEQIDYQQFTLGKDWREYHIHPIRYVIAWLSIKVQYYLNFWHYFLVTLINIVIVIYTYFPMIF